MISVTPASRYKRDVYRLIALFAARALRAAFIMSASSTPFSDPFLNAEWMPLGWDMTLSDIVDCHLKLQYFV